MMGLLPGPNGDDPQEIRAKVGSRTEMLKRARNGQGRGKGGKGGDDRGGGLEHELADR